MADLKPYELNPRGHTWARDDDGDIDIFGYEAAQYCNGPVCTSCGYGFCHHCDDGPAEDCSRPVIEARPTPEGAE